MGKERAIFAILLVGGVAVGLVGCGSSGSAEVGFAEVSSADGGDDDWSLEPEGGWPDADTRTDEPSGGAPSFGDGPPPPQPFTCTGKTGKTGDHTVRIKSGNLNRSALLHVPPSYDPGKGTALVLNFHGFTSADWQQRLLSRMDATSDARGFIVAYPAGIASSWNAGQCCGTAWLDAVNDVQFVKDLISEISNEYCIDPKRIYATGMSNGGFFSYRLACELSDVIAAIAPVAGVLGMPPELCHPKRPIPVLHFHGTKDSVVPYGGGNPLVNLNIPGTLDFRSVEETVRTFRNLNGCVGEPVIIYAKGDAVCEQWANCQGGSEVTLCTIDGGGHTWPGGLPLPGGTSKDISATETMAEFFAAHPLP